MAGRLHGVDMIKQLKNNENLKRMNYFKTRKMYDKAFNGKHIDLKRATPEEIAEIRMRIKSEKRKENLKAIIALSISVGIVLALTFFILVSSRIW